MTFQVLKINGLRNLNDVVIFPAPQLNLICGNNGSGKTSLLEAIFLLSHGRSFRSHLTAPLVSHGQQGLQIYAEVLSQSQRKQQIGLQKSLTDSTQLRIDGEKGRCLADIAKMLPVLLLNPESYHLLSAGSSYRRKFMDWGVFHVEQSFYGLWKDFQRCLNQRNAALKQQPAQAKTWNTLFVTLAEQVEAMRQQFLSLFEPLFLQTVREFLPQVTELNLLYKPGWDKQRGLQAQLEACFSREVQQGHTLVGAHRADLQVNLANHMPAAAILSRGQQKLLVAGLSLAQAQLLAQVTGKKSLFLIDDLAAELDVGHRQRILQQLLAMEAQLFITGVERHDLAQWHALPGARLFHVEQGRIYHPE